MKAKKVLLFMFMLCVFSLARNDVHAAVVGDADGDGSVTLGDAQLSLKYALKIIPVDQAVLEVADVNGDSQVTLSDAQIILKAALKIENSIEDYKNYQTYDSKNNIVYNTYKISDGVICIAKNKNSYPIELDAEVVYYRNEQMLDASKDTNMCLEPGAECVLYFIAPFDSNYDQVDFESYKINMKSDKISNNIIYGVNQISVTSNFGADNVTAEIKNNSDTNFEFIDLSIVFYDKDGNVIEEDSRYVSCNKSGSTEYVTFDFPYDSNYHKIIPDSYKIFVNYAYIFTWMQ